MFFWILGLMVFGDFAWWVLSHRRVRGVLLRVAVAVFAAGQLLALASIFVSRWQMLPMDAYLPRWVHSMVLIWHIFVLLPWMLWQLGLGGIHLARWVAKRRKPAMEDPVPEPHGYSRRQFLRTAAVFVPPLVTASGAALGELQLDGFRVRRLTVDLPSLPPALDGLTIAHVTDSHVGRLTRGKVLERIVEETNALNADIVALTGDLINDSLRAMPPALDMVGGFRARHLVVTCEGNHDLIESPSAFYRAADKGGLPLLVNDTAAVTIRGQRVQVLGLPWSRARKGEPDPMEAAMRSLLAKREAGAWNLLLAHHPHAWDLAEDVPLMLAGHTHGGQLMLNEEVGFGPWMYRYWSGLYQRKAQALVVSNGVGNWFPVRLQAPAEIVHLTLRAHSAPA